MKDTVYLDVPSFKGKGMEINGKDKSITNLAEAEFVVALFMYLRLR